MTDQQKECTCTFAQRLVGDGCEVCNPRFAAEIAKENATAKPTKRGGYKHEGEARTVTAYVEVSVWEQLTAYAKAQGRTTSELLNEIIKASLGIPTRFGVKWEDDK